MALDGQLRADARSEELLDTLARTPDELWNNAAAERLAQITARDLDNKALFGLLAPYMPNSRPQASQECGKTETQLIGRHRSRQTS